MIKDIFKTSIYHTNVFNNKYKDYFVNVLNDCIKEQKVSVKSNVGGFQTPLLKFDNMENNEFEKNIINNLIIKNCTNFLKQFKIKKSFKLSNLFFWINKNFKSSFNKPHTHGVNCLSGIYYLNVPKDSGNLVFMDANKMHGQNSKFFDDINFFSEIIITPNNYDLILFFSETIHYVEPNNSDESRISMAFNINIEEV